MMQESGQTADVIVIGAGMAGLTAAAELQRAGCRVLVLDKGRGVGGRLASRRIGGAAFDHGAQFITARTSRFAALVEDCRRAGAAEEWHRGVGDSPDGHVRWRGHPAMTSVAKHLARGLEIILDTRVVALTASRHLWSAETETGAVYSAGAVVLTPPVPQSLAILKAGAVRPSAGDPRQARGHRVRALPGRDGRARGPVASGAARRPGARRRPDSLDRGQSVEGHLGGARCHDSRHARLQSGTLGTRSAGQRPSTARRRERLAGLGGADIPGSRLALQQAAAGG